MAKIQKITTAEVSAIITETYESEEAAAGDAQPSDTDVQVIEIKTDTLTGRR